MVTWSWHRRHALARRRLTVAVMLSAYLVTTIGVPVQARVEKSGGLPFPCQDHACGCLTAEQCRESCCCYSAAERIEWAHDQGVEPPAHWISEVAADQRAAASGGPAPSSPRGCCSHQDDQPACHEDDADHEHADHNHAAQSCCDEDASSDTHIVFSFSARTCRGLSSLWCVTGAVIAAPVVSWQFQWNVVEWLSPFGDALASGDLAPPVPPPRV